MGNEMGPCKEIMQEGCNGSPLNPILTPQGDTFQCQNDLCGGCNCKCCTKRGVSVGFKIAV